MSDEEEIFREDDEDTEMEKGSSDLDFVRERLEDESGGMEAYRQALESIQDPQLKEMLQAIQEDEQKHQAALEQWMQEHGEGEDEGPDEGAAVEEVPEDLPEEEEEPLDKEDDIFSDEEEEISGDDASDLIDDIREVLAEHEAEKAEDEEPEEDDEDEDLPEFLKEDDEDGEEEEDVIEKVLKCYRVPIRIKKGDQQIIYGIISEPNVTDLQGDRLSESEIAKACHKFMQTSQRISKEHAEPAKADIIESYIAPVDFTCGGQSVRKGSWVMAVKVHDPGLWQAIKKGEITGFSIGGHGTRIPI